MDLQLTNEQKAFQREVRDFLRENLPPSLHRKLAEGGKAEKHELVDWTRVLNARGWAVPHWPVEWGGTGWGPVEQMLFRDEVQQFPAPETLSFGTSMVGPVIYTFGSDAQKRRFLPRIANLDDWWCQGFSEPGAGSDLAALKTNARRDGGEWVVNGQKTWTTYAQYADWIFVLARTDPAAKKQKGISFLLIDMKSPGVTLRPIQLIDGGCEVNEIFFDDVRVPAENLVGEENKGWDYAKFLLGNERNGQARVGVTKARLNRIRQLASVSTHGETPLTGDPAFQHKLAGLEIELKALEVTLLRVVSDAGGVEAGRPNPASSILKIKGSELQQLSTELLMDVVGPFALPFRDGISDEAEVDEGSDDVAWANGAAATYFNLRKLSIYGGANEIQRSIIAKAILGL